jgi:hypothetical protein
MANFMNTAVLLLLLLQLRILLLTQFCYKIISVTSNMARNLCFQVNCNPKFHDFWALYKNQIYLLKHAIRNMKIKSDRNPPI